MVILCFWYITSCVAQGVWYKVVNTVQEATLTWSRKLNILVIPYILLFLSPLLHYPTRQYILKFKNWKKKKIETMKKREHLSQVSLDSNSNQSQI